MSIPTKYYVDNANNYLGGTNSEALSENEVPFPPGDARQRWNGVDYDPITQADIDVRKDQQANFRNLDPVFVAYIECVNDGSIVPGSDMNDAQINNAIRAKL